MLISIVTYLKSSEWYLKFVENFFSSSDLGNEM
ncbi:Uncharacterised protein [Vibrio cholerae]|nr:Uncharacterised protein [Vibrio cholerae]